MVTTKGFFERKREWSVIKDNILAWYLGPYIAKILATHRPLLIVDCFAGKGKFDDGNDGSPLIILKSIMNTQSKQTDARIFCDLIEKKYHNELEANIDSFHISGMYPKVKVLKGTFEEHVDNLIKNIDRNYNVFFYIDPYGHKSLNFNRFLRIKNKGLKSVEMLINFNSFGFLREGCRLLKIREDELIATGFDYETDESNDIDNMNAVANGDYWIDILKHYRDGKITAHVAEEIFIDGYMGQLGRLFNHTINIPVKLKTNNMPKYRLIFGTNHPDGIILMADKMNQVWEEIVMKEREGQLSLFDFDYPDGFSSEIVRVNIIKELKTVDDFIELKKLICLLIEKYGLPMAKRVTMSELKRMEQMGIIEIDRNPPKTLTGRQVTSLDYDKYKIKVRIKQ